jgi:hypothetical protein
VRRLRLRGPVPSAAGGQPEGSTVALLAVLLTVLRMLVS